MTQIVQEPDPEELVSLATATAAVAGPACEDRAGLRSRSFLCLLATHILGTANDNMYRWLVVPIGTYLLGNNGEARGFALAVGGACFTLPYLVLATYAGYLGDRLSKRTVVAGCKLVEVLIMLVGVLAIWQGSPLVMFAVVGLLGAQSALLSPSKFGSIPEILRPDRISLGNGVMGLATVTSTALGFVGGYGLYELSPPDGRQQLPLIATLVVGLSAVGFLTSLGIRRCPAAQPHLPFPRNPIRETWSQLRLLGSSRPILRTVLGIAFFWMLASLAQMNIAIYGERLQLPDRYIGLLMAILVSGVGLGSVLAGLWSGGKVELGIVPLGAAGMALSSLLLFGTGRSVSPADPLSAQQAFAWSCVWLFTLGASAGLFSVPLDAFLQHRSPSDTRGAILAGANFVAFSAILVSSGVFYGLTQQLGISAETVFLVAGLGTMPVLAYVLFLLPDATIRFVVWLASHTMYRVRVYGKQNLPETGGALLVANHVSWVDGILLLISSSRPIRFLAYADYVKLPGLSWLAKVFHVIPIKGDEGPKSIIRSLQLAREALLQGDLVCIFAEGSLTRTGQLQPFQRGLLKIVEGTGAPVIPVWLDGLWGSIFSYRDGRFFTKWPRKWPYPVGVLFGQPLSEPDNVHQVRQAVEQLGVHAMEHRKPRELVLPRLFLRRCRRNMRQRKLADSSGQELTAGETLLRSLVIKRHLEQRVLAADERFVGVLLPPSVAGALVNIALPLARRVPVNLNYTVAPDVIQSCITQCGIKHVITSKLFLSRLKLELNCDVIYLEDLPAQLTKVDKAIAAIQAYATPLFLLERLLGLTRLQPDDLATIIFTSGSTGEPKGVMLSYNNVGSNIDAIDQLFQLTPADVFIGVLPFFHSFGYTGTLWTVLTLDPMGVYHFNPLDPRVIGTLCEKYKGTILMATPTFLRTYHKRCEPEQLKSLDLVVVGAEKMPLDLAQNFQDKFQVRPIEGYGTTELSPLAAVNVPDHRSANVSQKGTKEGTVGRAIPGTSAKVVDPDTGADLGVDKPGLLLIKGPNVMQGYLHKPELTAKVIVDGWYTTGDIAVIDSEGFIRITDRLSRFSKIGGEMVPHIKIEEILNQILAGGDDTDYELKAVVTAVPDEKKGERLIVVHKPFSKPFEQVCSELEASGLPNLWIPGRDCYMEVPELPILGTGKLDLKGLKSLAMEKFAPR